MPLCPTVSNFMTIINLTPHGVQVYNEDQFVGLEQVNPTTWVADSVEGNPILDLPSVGSLRISTATVDGDPIDGVPIVETTYGELVGLPTDYIDQFMIVSLPCQSMAKQSGHNLASKMLAPYKVVRLRSNTSQVLGCMGFTK